MLTFSVIIYQFYSSFIVASLLTEAPKNIKTVRQLLNSELQCSIDEISYIRDHIEHYKDESVVQLYKKITEHPNPFLPLRQGLELVKKGGHAFYTDGNHAYPLLKGILGNFRRLSLYESFQRILELLTDREACSLQEIIYVPKNPGGPCIPNKSPFRELIKIR